MTHRWQRPFPPIIGSVVRIQRCVTPHTPLALLQRCCHLCPKNLHWSSMRFLARLQKERFRMRCPLPRQAALSWPAMGDVTLLGTASLPNGWSVKCRAQTTELRTFLIKFKHWTFVVCSASDLLITCNHYCCLPPTRCLNFLSFCLSFFFSFFIGSIYRSSSRKGKGRVMNCAYAYGTTLLVSAAVWPASLPMHCPVWNCSLLCVIILIG